MVKEDKVVLENEEATEVASLSTLDDQPVDEDSVDPKIYEVGYIIVPSVHEENLASEVGKIKSLIEERSKAVISEEFPTMKELAYEMTKHILGKNERYSKGYFGFVKFESDRNNISLLKKDLDHLETILRYIIINTVRENTMSPHKSHFAKRIETFKDSSTPRPKKKEVETNPMTEEEMDKEINKTLENLEV